MSDATRLQEFEALRALIPPCPEHGVGCIDYAMQWLRQAVPLMAREEQLRAAAATADPSTVQELLETQIRLIEAENDRIKRMGVAMLLAVQDVIGAIKETGTIEAIYIGLAGKMNAKISDSREAVRAFGEALGVPLAPSEKTE